MTILSMRSISTSAHLMNYPTFGTKFPFETTTNNEENTEEGDETLKNSTEVDTDTLQKQLFDILNRLAKNYKNDSSGPDGWKWNLSIGN